MPPNSLDQLYQKADDPRAAGQRLLKVYRHMLDSNARQNKEGVRHGLALLRATLDYQADPALARNLAGIYQQIEAALEANHFATIGESLETISGLWSARIYCEDLSEKAADSG